MYVQCSINSFLAWTVQKPRHACSKWPNHQHQLGYAKLMWQSFRRAYNRAMYRNRMSREVRSVPGHWGHHYYRTRHYSSIKACRSQSCTTPHLYHVSSNCLSSYTWHKSLPIRPRLLFPKKRVSRRSSSWARSTGDNRRREITGQ